VPARRIPDARTLQREAVLAVGGLRAIVLQVAHPAVGHGVAEHSTFAHDPLARLHATLSFVYVVADGDERLTAAVARSVGRAHRPVVSAPGETVPYDARDPELQRWVAATLHETALRMAELVWGPLPRPLADELLARSGRFATVLGMPAALWPADSEAFDRYYRAASDALRFDDATAAVIRELVAARSAPRWVRASLPPLVALTAPLLPPALQLQLGWDAVRGRRAVAALIRLLAPVYRALPAALRALPSRRYLAAAERTWGGADGSVPAA
jgi:uncharacterized protein (DUF2236 family)